MMNETASNEEDGPTLPPSTAPKAFPLSVSGNFDSEEQARMLANNVYATIQILGSYIDLERLDGVTVADDYDSALQQLDRGFTPSRPLTRSNSERITGVAMSPAVKRDGVVKAHLLFAAWANICEPLRMFGYLLGTLDGREATFEEAAPDAVAAIAGGPYTELFARTQVILRDLWTNRRQWLSTASFEPLRQVVRDALKEAGVVLTVLSDGRVHIGFPFLPGTIPGDS